MSLRLEYIRTCSSDTILYYVGHVSVVYPPPSAAAATTTAAAAATATTSAAYGAKNQHIKSPTLPYLRLHQRMLQGFSVKQTKSLYTQLNRVFNMSDKE